MTKQHSITPPKELLSEWAEEYDFRRIHERNIVSYPYFLATKAAQWGADQELDACVDWLLNSAVDSAETLNPYANALRAARRPKPPSLKEQALNLLQPEGTPARVLNEDQLGIIRRALESLPE